MTWTSLEVLNTVLLDDRIAARPIPGRWRGLATASWLCVTHAGTHELSVIDFPALLQEAGRAARHAPAPVGEG